MKKFMRPKLEEPATKSSPTPAVSATTTHATPTQAATKVATAKQAAEKQAAAKLAAAKHTAEKQAAANQAAAKQAAANQAAAKQAAARLEAERQESVRQEATRQAAEGHGEDERARVVADEEIVHPTNAGRTELIPNIFWFSKPIVAAGVTDSFRAHYNYPYMNWTEVPETVRDRWFMEFQRKFTWKPEYDDMVRRDYEKKGIDRLKDHVNKAAKVPLHKRISWMTETVRAEFIRKREHPDFIKRSDKAKKNRYSNQSDTSFDPGHRQGSVSTVEVAERLAAVKNGVLPLAADVYEKTHGFEMPDGEKMMIGDRPKKTMAEYKEKLAEYNDKGVTKAPDEVFLEVVGGRKKGGKVYGLGSASSMFYEAGGSSQTNQSTHSISIISQLSSQLEECKKMVEESKKKAEDNNEECKKMVEESKKIAEDSKKVAENSLKVAQASQEKHEKEKGEWKKEKEELVASMTKLKKAVAEVFSLILKERSFDPHDPLKDCPFTSL